MHACMYNIRAWCIKWRTNFYNWLNSASFFLHMAVFCAGFSPGPAYAIDPTITIRGKDGTPRFSISGRHKDLSELATDRST